MVKCLPEFEYFTVFLKKRNFISKISKSKVTDYAALIEQNSLISLVHMHNIHPGANIHPGCKFAPGVYFGHVNKAL